MPITRAQIQTTLSLLTPLSFDTPSERRDDRYDDDRLTPCQHVRGQGVALELLGDPEALHLVTLGVALTPDRPAQLTFGIALAGPLLAAAWPEDVLLLKWYMEQVTRALFSLTRVEVTHPERTVRLTCDPRTKQLMLHIGLWDNDR